MLVICQPWLACRYLRSRYKAYRVIYESRALVARVAAYFFLRDHALLVSAQALFLRTDDTTPTLVSAGGTRRRYN